MQRLSLFVVVIILYSCNFIESLYLSKCSINDTKPILIQTALNGRLKGYCEHVEINDVFTSSNVYTWLSIPISSGNQSEVNIWLPAEAYLKINVKSVQRTQFKGVPILVFMSSKPSGGIMNLLEPSKVVTLFGYIVITVNGVGSRGNDKQLALKWIYDNVQSIGGDSRQIIVLQSSNYLDFLRTRTSGANNGNYGKVSTFTSSNTFIENEEENKTVVPVELSESTVKSSSSSLIISKSINAVLILSLMIFSFL